MAEANERELTLDEDIRTLSEVLLLFYDIPVRVLR